MREHRRRAPSDHSTPGDGYTLIELLLVLVMLGAMVSVVVIAVSGMRTEAAETSCDADRRQLAVAAETYFAERGHVTVPPTGLGHDRHERTLVDVGLLRQHSAFHDLAADGTITRGVDSPC